MQKERLEKYRGEKYYIDPMGRADVLEIITEKRKTQAY